MPFNIEEEKREEEFVERLCKENGFKLRVGATYTINSKYDKWFFATKFQRKNTHIELMHENHYGKAGVHFQRKRFYSIESIFEYIKKHDEKRVRDNHWLYRTQESFDAMLREGLKEVYGDDTEKIEEVIRERVNC